VAKPALSSVSSSWRAGASAGVSRSRDQSDPAAVDAASEASAPDASLVYVIGRVNQGIRRELGVALRPWDLSIQEYTALSVLRSRPGLSNAQLARRALVSPQSMLEIIGRLTDRGLIFRAVDPAHRRVLRAELTTAGTRLLETASPAVEAVQDRVFADVSAAQRRTLMAALQAAMVRLSSRP
jgi:DNA-binding MarR family transcriptional regulator